VEAGSPYIARLTDICAWRFGIRELVYWIAVVATLLRLS